MFAGGRRCPAEEVPLRREWEPEELIAYWTLLEGDAALVGNKAGPTRLGFVLLLKFFEFEGRFPREAAEVPEAAAAYVAQQVGVEPGDLAAYDWSGRTFKYHRAQIRAAFGFRESTRADEDRLTAWLAEEVCPLELVEARRRDALLARCQEERIEPPGRLDRILAAAGATFDKRCCAQVAARLPAAGRSRLEGLIAEVDEGDSPGGRRGALAELKADPGQVGLETLMNEIAVLGRVRSLGLPEDLFARDLSVAVALAGPHDEQGTPGRLPDVVHVEADRLPDAEAGVEGQQGQGAVPGARTCLHCSQPSDRLLLLQGPGRTLGHLQPPGLGCAEPETDVEVVQGGQDGVDRRRPAPGNRQERTVVTYRPVPRCLVGQGIALHRRTFEPSEVLADPRGVRPAGVIVDRSDGERADIADMDLLQRCVQRCRRGATAASARGCPVIGRGFRGMRWPTPSVIGSHDRSLLPVIKVIRKHCELLSGALTPYGEPD